MNCRPATPADVKPHCRRLVEPGTRYIYSATSLCKSWIRARLQLLHQPKRNFTLHDLKSLVTLQANPPSCLTSKEVRAPPDRPDYFTSYTTAAWTSSPPNRLYIERPSLDVTQLLSPGPISTLLPAHFSHQTIRTHPTFLTLSLLLSGGGGGGILGGVTSTLGNTTKGVTDTVGNTVGSVGKGQQCPPLSKSLSHLTNEPHRCRRRRWSSW